MIELSHVSKTFAPAFGRSARALDDVSLRVAAGEVAGISGPAGAGKSTLLSLVLGHERPTSGSVRVDGIEARRFVEREGMAYVSQRLALPGRWRVVDALTRLAMLSGVRATETTARVNDAIRDLALTEDRRRRLKSFTQDARTRFGLAQALIADHRVIVLDEPLDGLSTESLELLRQLIGKLRAFDRAILIASRDTAELQRLTDRVTFIDRGRVRRIGAQRSMTPATVETVFHLAIHHGAEHIAAVFPMAVSLGRGLYSVRVSVAALNRGLRDLLDRGVLLTSVAPVNATIEPSPADAMDGVAT